MKIILLLALVFMPLFASLTNASELLNLEIPLIEKHNKLSKEVNKNFYNKSVSYEVSLNNTHYISEFYDKWFTKSGWVDPLKNQNFPAPSMSNKNWNSYQIDYVNDSPVIIYGKHWENKNLKSIATVTAKITDFNKGMFKIRVSVSLSPKVHPNGLFKLNNLVMEHPSNVFILNKLLKANPLDITKVNLKNAKKHQGNGLVRKYLNIVKEIEAEFQTWANN